MTSHMATMRKERALLAIRDLHVAVSGKEIVKGISLDVGSGEIHAIMGPNGSGKSTLVNALMGHPHLDVTKGSATYQGKDLLGMAPEDRAKSGLFLAFQYPRSIAGVSLRSFLFAAYNAQQAARIPKAKKMSPIQFRTFLEEQLRELNMDSAFADRAVNEGFSGGEKKKAEILQMKVLQPILALLDETDSGLDIDALKVVADGVNQMRAARHPSTRSVVAPLAQGDTAGRFTALLVTHYARILRYLAPDRVHVMVGGTIVESGGADLAERLEREGYERYSKIDNRRRALTLKVG